MGDCSSDVVSYGYRVDSRIALQSSGELAEVAEEGVSCSLRLSESAAGRRRRLSRTRNTGSALH